MSRGRVARLGVFVALSTLSMTVAASAGGVRSTRRNQAVDPSAMQRSDTLPPWGRALSDTRIEVERDKFAIDPLVEQVRAAIDARTGRATVPARLVLNEYRREGRAVVIDLTAESFPQLVFKNAGGTVRILSDGRRVVLARHG
jgi:hypothetical protein